MEISNQIHVKASEIPLERLAKNPQVSEKDKIEELSRQFEAVLVRQILSEAQKTVFHSEYSQESAASNIYRDMVTEKLADSISKSGMLGFGTSLCRQLGAQLKSDSTQSSNPDATTP